MTAGEVQEVEMNLELSAEAADAVEAAGLFAAEPEVVRQHAVYFDTPGHALSKGGLSLRIRRNGDRRVQTIKIDGAAAAGVFVRPEWERDVEDDRPVLDDTTPIPALIGDKVAKVAALFALARRIDAVAPVHLGVLSKARRGYRLLGSAPTATKAEPIALTSPMTAADAFPGHRPRLHRAVPPERAADPRPRGSGRAASGPRGAAPAAFGFLDPQGDAGGRQLRRARRGTALAGRRAGPGARSRVLLERAGDGPLRDRLGQARAAAYADAAEALRSDRARALMIDLVEWIAIGEWRSVPEGAEIRDLPAREFAAKARWDQASRMIAT